MQHHVSLQYWFGCIGFCGTVHGRACTIIIATDTLAILPPLQKVPSQACQGEKGEASTGSEESHQIREGNRASWVSRDLFSTPQGMFGGRGTKKSMHC